MDIVKVSTLFKKNKKSIKSFCLLCKTKPIRFRLNLFKLSILFLTLLYPLVLSAQSFNNIAFNYALHPPMNLLKVFDIVVIDSRSHILPKQYPQTRLFAYISVGEQKPSEKNIQDNWIIAKNPIWKTEVIDQSNPHWQKFFMQKIFEPLWQKGYRGFFLDTLDSYILGAQTKTEQEKQIKGLVTLIKNIKRQHPTAEIIINRGLELLPQIHTDIYAIAVESLFSGWNQNTQTYYPIEKKQRTELLTQLKIAQKYKLPIIGIDYVAPENQEKALEIAQKIAALNLIPYVTDRDLQTIGISNIQLIPRTIITLYDQQETPKLMNADPLIYGAMPLEYYGYIPLFYDIQQNLPLNITNNQIAGIFLWLSTDSLANNVKLQQWLIKQKNKHIPIVFLGDIGDSLTETFKKAFGFSTLSNYPIPQSVTISKQTNMVGFEFPIIPNIYEFKSIQINKGKIVLSLFDNQHTQFNAAAITNWGGYALNPYVIYSLPNNQSRWIINPMLFFPAAFKFKQFPIPDVTTENGLRLLLIHVDGDGFDNRSEFGDNLLSGAVMLNEIFKKYPIPQTVSIIEGVISSHGLYPKIATEAQKIAKDIFKLPWIEIASHSYSHPFNWEAAEKHLEVKESDLTTEGFYLHIPNYKFNLIRDIKGSVDYIDQYLAPTNKRCKIFLWTGDCNPSAQAVGLTYKLGLLNMNGGDTTILKNNNSLTNIAPLGVYKGKYFQVFAPNQNENIYTNSWSGPFYGYRRAIETFELTDKPYRFKPIDIYYHFFSASKLAGLKALKTVYNWALAQPIFNIYTSEYIKKVLDYNNIVIAKNLNGGFIIISNGNLRELRLPFSAGYPDLETSQNIIGYSTYNDNYYIHLGSKNRTYLKLIKQPPTLPYIIKSNGFINNFARSKQTTIFNLTSHVVPINLTLGNISQCEIYDGKKLIKEKSSTQQITTFYFKTKVQHEISILCKQ